jgi:hypothetical protein
MRLLLKILGILLVVVLLAVIYVATNLGGLLKKGVETYAPPLLGTAVVLDSATIKPLSGAGSVQGLAIAQPDGFGPGNAIVLDQASVGIDLPSLRGDPIIVKHILVDGPALNYVQTGDGNNLQTLLNNIKGQSGSTEKAEPGPDGETGGTGETDDDAQQEDSAAPSKKIIVDQLTISNVNVTASSPLLPGESVGLTLEPIEMKHLGRAEGGLTAAQLLTQIAQRLNAQVQKSVADSAEFKAMLEDAAKQKAREEVDRTLDRELGGEGAKQVKGLLDKYQR